LYIVHFNGQTSYVSKYMYCRICWARSFSDGCTFFQSDKFCTYYS